MRNKNKTKAQIWTISHTYTLCNIKAKEQVWVMRYITHQHPMPLDKFRL